MMRVRRLENKVWLMDGIYLLINGSEAVLTTVMQRSKTAMDPGVLAQADEIYLLTV